MLKHGAEIGSQKALFLYRFLMRATDQQINFGCDMSHLKPTLKNVRLKLKGLKVTWCTISKDGATNPLPQHNG
jgi:hypothetical protein